MSDRRKIIVKTITGFDWGNYGLDEVGMIRPKDADYASALADEILAKLDGEPSDAA